MSYLERGIGIIRYNIKIICNLNFAAAICLTLLAPVIFSFRMLSFNDMAVIGEFYLSIIGIVMFSYIGDIENRHNTEEVLYWRKTPHTLVFTVRMLIMMAVTLALIISTIAWAKFNSGEFAVWNLAGGIWVSAVFLGLVGLTAANLTGNITTGYLLSFGYYAFEMFTKGKYTGKLYLFSLTSGSYQEKYILLAMILIMCTVNIIYIQRKS